MPKLVSKSVASKIYSFENKSKSKIRNKIKFKNFQLDKKLELQSQLLVKID